MIVFKPKYDDQDEFHLVFSKKQNYDIVRGPAMIFINLTQQISDVGKGWRTFTL